MFLSRPMVRPNVGFYTLCQRVSPALGNNRTHPVVKRAESKLREALYRKCYGMLSLTLSCNSPLTGIGGMTIKQHTPPRLVGPSPWISTAQQQSRMSIYVLMGGLLQPRSGISGIRCGYPSRPATWFRTWCKDHLQDRTRNANSALH